MKNDDPYVNPTTDTDFRRQVTDMLLGSDWHVVDSMNQEQVNTIAIEEIKRKHNESIWRKLLRNKYFRYLSPYFICLIGFALSETLLERGMIQFVISTQCLVWMAIFSLRFVFKGGLK